MRRCCQAMAKGSNARAALLAVTMNFVPATPVDIFRFLQVPAIVMTIRRVRGRMYSDAHAHPKPARRSLWRRRTVIPPRT